jgi:hypothetical protein
VHTDRAARAAKLVESSNSNDNNSNMNDDDRNTLRRRCIARLSWFGAVESLDVAQLLARPTYSQTLL